MRLPSIFVLWDQFNGENENLSVLIFNHLRFQSNYLANKITLTKSSLWNVLGRFIMLLYSNASHVWSWCSIKCGAEKTPSVYCYRQCWVIKLISYRTCGLKLKALSLCFPWWCWDKQREVTGTCWGLMKTMPRNQEGTRNTGKQPKKKLIRLWDKNNNKKSKVIDRCKRCVDIRMAEQFATLLRAPHT